MAKDVKIFFKDESCKIIGACMRVHRILGPGFLEAVYQEALSKEFIKENIPFQEQVKLNVFYGEEKLKKYYKADYICYDSIVIEIKALNFMHSNLSYQLKNYLMATKKELGILVNFGQPSLNYRRIINPKNSNNS